MPGRCHRRRRPHRHFLDVQRHGTAATNLWCRWPRGGQSGRSDINRSAARARGFEFLQQRWANAVDFPEEADGADPVIGPSSVATIHREDGPVRQVAFGQFVRTEGALYAFSPSISTIGRLSRGEL